MNLLSEKKGKELLTLARDSVLSGKKQPINAPSSQLGAFITLYVNGKERGCAGTPYPGTSLEDLVQDCAIFASTKDTRYPKIENHEHKDLTLLLSILTPPKKINVEQIKIGVHGLIITQGDLSGLYLPHVAQECGWTIKTFLEETCLKGGLSKEAWTQGAKISVFETHCFSEE